MGHPAGDGDPDEHHSRGVDRAQHCVSQRIEGAEEKSQPARPHDGGGTDLYGAGGVVDAADCRERGGYRDAPEQQGGAGWWADCQAGAAFAGGEDREEGGVEGELSAAGTNFTRAKVIGTDTPQSRRCIGHPA